MSTNPFSNRGPFLPTSLVFPDDQQERNVVLTEMYIDIANSMNVREVGIYDQVELLAGQTFFDPANAQNKRDVFRRVYNIGAIAAGATLNTAHGLTGITSYTHIYGTCVTDAIDFRPLPYVSTVALNQQISLTITPINIVIVNGAASANITSAIVVLEYLKT